MEIKIKELPASIGTLDKLVELRLENCRRLENFPTSMCLLRSLKFFSSLGLLISPKYTQVTEESHNNMFK